MIENITKNTLHELSGLVDEVEGKWLELSSGAQQEIDDVFHEGVSHHIRWLQNNISDLLKGDMDIKETLTAADQTDAEESGDLARIEERKKDLYLALNATPIDAITVDQYLTDGFGRDIVTVFALENDNVMLAQMLIEHAELLVANNIIDLAESDEDHVAEYKPGF